MGQAMMVVSWEVLRALLHLPEAAQIVSAGGLAQATTGACFVVEHEDFGDDEENMAMVRPVFVRSGEWCRRAEFTGWE